MPIFFQQVNGNFPVNGIIVCKQNPQAAGESFFPNSMSRNKRLFPIWPFRASVRQSVTVNVTFRLSSRSPSYHHSQSAATYVIDAGLFQCIWQSVTVGMDGGGKSGWSPLCSH